MTPPLFTGLLAIFSSGKSYKTVKRPSPNAYLCIPTPHQPQPVGHKMLFDMLYKNRKHHYNIILKCFIHPQRSSY